MALLCDQLQWITPHLNGWHYGH
uniref:Uncharacterized protein n=1 Tax=Rhizophora mucronata TaxID=61149 RepID=A0A2P2QMH5_RHIMU